MPTNTPKKLWIKCEAPKQYLKNSLPNYLDSNLLEKEACEKYGISRSAYYDYIRKSPNSNLATTTRRVDTSGENNHLSKANWKLVDVIRTDYETNKTPYSEMVKKYNLSKTTISRIIRKESWVR